MHPLASLLASPLAPPRTPSPSSPSSQTIDLPAFRRITTAVHRHSVSSATAACGTPAAATDAKSTAAAVLAPHHAALAYHQPLPAASRSPYYTPPATAPHPTAHAPAGGVLFGGASAYDPPPTAYEAYLMAAGAAPMPVQPPLAAPAPPPQYPHHQPPQHPHQYPAQYPAQHYSGPLGLTTAQVREQAATAGAARAALATDARRSARKPTSPAKLSSTKLSSSTATAASFDTAASARAISRHQPTSARAGEYEAAYALPAATRHVPHAGGYHLPRGAA